MNWRIELLESLGTHHEGVSGSSPDNEVTEPNSRRDSRRASIAGTGKSVGRGHRRSLPEVIISTGPQKGSKCREYEQEGPERRTWFRSRDYRMRFASSVDCRLLASLGVNLRALRLAPWNYAVSHEK